MVKPECRVGLPRAVILAYLLGFWRFIRTENPWVGDSHSVYFRLFRYRFELGKLAKHPSGVWFSFSKASRRVDESTSSESASHGDLRGSMRPYMSDTSSDAPGDDPPQDRGRGVRRPPPCGTGGFLEEPPARRGRRGGRHGE
ncbi:hypothetical protein PIB30_090393 [Stylosanthes scabra]|uniref:Uncharacterized protein n=1 Tax=Stylosanthes scabra TaxID=79078 RepID=A0ABU6RU84_9FABA|nr:hypothetical protein [Stylosanthes scabra]